MKLNAELTKTELVVTSYIASGLMKKEIADLIRRSPSTVDNHCDHIYKKIGVHTNCEVAAWWWINEFGLPIDALPQILISKIKKSAVVLLFLLIVPVEIVSQFDSVRRVCTRSVRCRRAREYEEIDLSNDLSLNFLS